MDHIEVPLVSGDGPGSATAATASTGAGGRTHGFVEVADRVFVARYRQWDVNVGLVLGRDGAVVIDTRASDVQGRQVLDDVRRLGRDIEVRHVVSTHVHFDHTFGNVAFDAATVHAHDNVGRTLEEAARHVKEALRADPAAAPEFGYTERDAAEVMATQVRGPDRTFGSNATIDLGDRCVTMTYAGRGHTDGDVAVVVPDTDAIFLGDLVEESAHPSFGGDCWPLEWADTLTSHLLQADEGAVVVPGHGRPVDVDFVTRQRDDVATVAAVIRERRLGGGSLEEALRDLDPRLPYPLAYLESAIRRGWEHLVPPTP
ncbi:MBL fold metallo-hydrolase [Terrabacter sp. 2RAF25]|uniref:MBL fold metallo-hydrolase n=1 Tax=Terrabacter sp. 2RAF25 TaxID=3232998 RepID=UPI003F954B38